MVLFRGYPDPSCETGLPANEERACRSRGGAARRRSAARDSGTEERLDRGMKEAFGECEPRNEWRERAIRHRQGIQPGGRPSTSNIRDVAVA